MSELTYCYKHPRPALTVDCVVFGLDAQNSLKLLLIQRKKYPFEHRWALPGGYVRSKGKEAYQSLEKEADQSLEAAARRELREETGVDLNHIFLEQLHTFGSAERDPRGWTASVSYYALVNLDEYCLEAATDASDAAWFAINNIPSLAFDHHDIVALAIEKLRKKVRYEPIGFELLPKRFTIPQLQKLYETILDRRLDRRNFFRKLRKMDFLIELDATQESVSHRPAKLYKFDRDRYVQLKQGGFNFEI